MALTCNWTTKVITVPQSDLTLDSGTRYTLTVIYWFQLLRELNGSVEGMAMTIGEPIYRNVAPTASTPRIVDVINGYTVEFEDGLYAVEFTNGNTNYRDVEIKNSVSVGTNNTTGFIDPTFLEFGTFNGGVTVDTTSPWSGITYPTGTAAKKVNNVGDAILIDNDRFHKLYLDSDIEINGGHDLTKYILVGRSHVDINVLILDSAIVNKVTIEKCILNGILDGDTDVQFSVVETISYMNGHIHNSGLKGLIVLGGAKPALLDDCKQADPNIIPEIDMNVGGQDLMNTNYAGKMLYSNLNDSITKINTGLVTGAVILDWTVTSGIVSAAGNGDIIDPDGNHIPSGIWNGGVTIINKCINEHTIRKAIMESIVADYSSTPGTLAEAISDLLLAGGSLTVEQGRQLKELYQIQGLDVNNPLTITQTQKIVADIVLALAGDGESLTTVTRE